MEQFNRMINNQMTDDELYEYITTTPVKTLSKLCDKARGKRYHYMMTFTIDPSRHDTNNLDLQTEIENYIKKRTKTIKSVIESYIVKEGGDDDHKHTHWHVSILSDQPIKKSRWSYYNTLYGMFDYSPSRDGNNQEALNYMSKQRVPELIT